MIKRIQETVHKYGPSLPYGIVQWQCVRKCFQAYAEKLKKKSPSGVHLHRHTVDALYSLKSLEEDCQRILKDERRILFYDTSEMRPHDPKYRWEEKRMQHLYPLAILISRTNRRDVIDYFVQELQCYDADPGLEDTNAMEVAIDSINLITAYQTTGLNDDDVQALTVQIVWRNLIYMLQHMENGLIFSNNHYFFDLLGVLWITEEIVQDDVIVISQLHAFAEKEMCRLLAQIISPDGSLYEGSSYYTRYVAEALCEYVYYHATKQPLYADVLSRLVSFL